MARSNQNKSTTVPETNTVEGTLAEEQVEAVLEAPQGVQLGQSDIGNQTSEQEQFERDLVTLAEEQADERAAEAAKAIERGRKDLAKVRGQGRSAQVKERNVTRFYLADPMRRKTVYRAGNAYPLRFRNGVLTVEDGEDAELVRNTLKGVAFEQDFPDDKTPPACVTCGYAPRSYAAFAAHQEKHPSTR